MQHETTIITAGMHESASVPVKSVQMETEQKRGRRTHTHTHTYRQRPEHLMAHEDVHTHAHRKA